MHSVIIIAAARRAAQNRAYSGAFGGAGPHFSHFSRSNARIVEMNLRDRANMRYS
jgi:hypothetical protein